MSRSAGQVTARGVTLGTAAAVAVVVGIVWLCGWLVPPGTATVPIEAPVEDDPVQPGAVVCPASLQGPDPLPVVSSELFDCPDLYDGVRVTYTGEVIQAVLRRGPRAWVHLNDDVYALDAGPIASHRTALGGNAGVPVSIPIDVAEAIRSVGDGSGRGDLIEVVGTFHRADPDDGGGPTIQAATARITEHGGPVPIPVDGRRVVTALVLAALAVGLAGAVLRRRRA